MADRCASLPLLQQATLLTSDSERTDRQPRPFLHLGGKPDWFWRSTCWDGPEAGVANRPRDRPDPMQSPHRLRGGQGLASVKGSLGACLWQLLCPKKSNWAICMEIKCARLMTY